MFSKNEPRPEYNPEVLKEAYIKEERTYSIYQTFNPSLIHLPITSKFYSTYEQIDLSNPDQATLDRIVLYRAGVPRMKYMEPVTDNQIYGWHSKPLFPALRSDYRFNRPRVNEPRPYYNPEVLKEAFTKEDRAFTLYQTFNPSLIQLPISSKFYSVHEQSDLSNTDPDTLHRIKLYRSGVPKMKYEEPATENQKYGWHSDPLFPALRNDYRFHKPRKASITKIQFIVPRMKK